MLTGRFSSGTRSSCGVDHASLSSRSELTESPHPSSSEVPATTALHGLSQQQPGIDGGFMLLTIWAASLTVSLSSLPFRRFEQHHMPPAKAWPRGRVLYSTEGRDGACEPLWALEPSARLRGILSLAVEHSGRARDDPSSVTGAREQQRRR